MAALLVANEWISKNAVSSVPYVNRQLAIAIAEKTGLEVHSTVIDPNVSEEIETDANHSNVKLIKPHLTKEMKKLGENPSRKWLILHEAYYPHIKRLAVRTPIRLVIGHAACGEGNTADAACSLFKHVCAGTNTQLWTVVHIIPHRLIYQSQEFMHSSGLQEEKEKEIMEYAEISAVVAAVGQTAFRHFKNQFRGLDKKDLVFKCYLPHPDERFVIPMLNKAVINEHMEFLIVGNTGIESQERLRRFDCLTDAINKVSSDLVQWGTVAAPKLKVHLDSIDDKDLKTHLIDRIARTSGPSNLSIVTSSDTKSDAIKTALRQCALIVDQDRESAFSIIALNALAAGCPCLLSNHCGLAEFVTQDQTLRSSANALTPITVNIGAGYNHEAMVREWSSSLHGMLANYDKAFGRAQELSRLIQSSAREGQIAKAMLILMELCPSNEAEAVNRPGPFPVPSGSPTGPGRMQYSTSETQHVPESGGDDNDEQGSAMPSSSTHAQSQAPPKPMKDTSNKSSGCENIVDVILTAKDGMDNESQKEVEKAVLDDITNVDQLPTFRQYGQDNDATIEDISHGHSLVVTVKCKSLKGLETIWSDMWTGKLNEVFQKDLITKAVLAQVNTTTIALKANIRTWEYRRCKCNLELIALRERGAISSTHISGTEGKLPYRIKQSTKVIQDPIHGTIELDPVYTTIIDTPEFQRLRNIKKTGTVNYVYPGAVHTRFEHSIGTCYLALKLVRHLIENYQDALAITKEEELCVGLAALCIDLGQGPFSDLFEQRIIPSLIANNTIKSPITEHEEFKHTLLSVKIFDLMVKKYDLLDVFKAYGYRMDDKHLDLVKEMIHGPLHVSKTDYVNVTCTGETYQATSRYRYFLYEIVSNRLNRIDAKEWDGLARDSYHLGITHGNSMHDRFIKFARVLEEPRKEPETHKRAKRLCYREKEVPSACEMLRVRYRQRDLTTFHKVKIAIDVMITDAIVAAIPHLELRKPRGKLVDVSEMLTDMDVFMTLDDSICNDILKSSGDKLTEAQCILEKIQRREIYKLVSKMDIPKDMTEEDIRIDDILECEGNDGSLVKEDLRFVIVTKDYGIGDRNPLDAMLFYSKDNPTARYALPGEISDHLPKTFQERKLFVYVKDHDKMKIAKCVLKEYADMQTLSKSLERLFGREAIAAQPGIKHELGEGSPDETAPKRAKLK